MNLAEIFSKLPLDVGNVLEKHLESAAVSATPTRSEVLDAAARAVNQTRDELSDLSEDVNEILDQVPDASAEHLFGPIAVEQVAVNIAQLQPIRGPNETE